MCITGDVSPACSIQQPSLSWVGLGMGAWQDPQPIPARHRGWCPLPQQIFWQVLAPPMGMSPANPLQSSGVNERSLAVKQQEDERQRRCLLKEEDESTRQKAAILPLPARGAGSARPARLADATSRPTAAASPCSTAAAGRNLPASLSMLSNAQPVIHQPHLLFCVGRGSAAPASVAASAQLSLCEVLADESLAHLFSGA